MIRIKGQIIKIFILKFELHYQVSSLRIESLSADFEFLAPNTAFSGRTLHAT